MTTKSKFLQLFERDQGRCVYCGTDLKADFDRFVVATEDHLVPQSKKGSHDLGNLILSCMVCNRLKANFVPDPPKDAIAERRDYIADVRSHIMKRRAEKMKDFMKVTHPGQDDYQ